MKKSHPSANITHIPLDLASLASVKRAAEDFKSREKRLDILLNNAGIMAVPPGLTEDGVEIQLGTNHLGHFLLTRELLPVLEATAAAGGDVRVVNLSSYGHTMAFSGIALDQLAKPDGGGLGPWPRYGQSKLANILFAKGLASRYPGITSVSVHPGIITTDLYASSKENSFLLRWGLKLTSWMVFSGVEQGARNQLWASVAGKGALVNGAYYTPVGVKTDGTKFAQSEEWSERLWRWSEKTLEAKGF